MKFNFSGYNDKMKAQVAAWTKQCLSIPSSLILPVQRLPRYVLLIETLLKSTPDIVDEYPRLKDAYNLAKSVTARIDSEKKKIVRSETLLYYQKSIIDYNCDGPRYFIRDGNLTVKVKSKLKATVVIMSDVLYILVPKKKQFNIEFKYDKIYSI